MSLTHNALFIHTSAKTGQGVVSLFDQIAEKIYD
jgi:translation initiation factor IF-2